jgi:signal peptidase II
MKTKSWKLHLLIILLGIALDQSTKIWAVKTFSSPSGEVNYHHTMKIAGDWIQFRLVYNRGAAFGLQPQKIFSFLNPTVFYGIISLIAITILFLFYKKIPPEEFSTQIGICLIVAGAFGNIIDRFRIHKVVDFIDVGIPQIQPRWPTFNVADSLVCIGVGCILILPLVLKKSAKDEKQVEANH